MKSSLSLPAANLQTTLTEDFAMTPEYLRECFTYNQSGTLTWNKRPLSHFLSEREWKLVNTRCAGKIAGSERLRNDGVGYLYVKVNGKNEAVHRIVLFMHGVEIPKGMQVDHINQDKQDNRIENLRVTTPTQNCMNQRMPTHNTSGHMNVLWRSDRQKWMVKFVINGKVKKFGHYSNKRDAIIRRDQIAAELGISELHGKERGD
jgi:hypothetical protein